MADAYCVGDLLEVHVGNEDDAGGCKESREKERTCCKESREKEAASCKEGREKEALGYEKRKLKTLERKHKKQALKTGRKGGKADGPG